MSPHVEIRADGRDGKKITCFLAHDYVLLREGVRRLLEDEADIEVLGEAATAIEALRDISEHQPDVVIADPGLFGGDREICVHSILEKSARSKVLFLTSDHAEGPIAEHPGARHAVRRTSAGQLIELVRSMGASAPSDQERRGGNIAEWPDKASRQRSLTIRERQVLKLLAEGHTVRSVANVLGLSVKTVDAHKFNLMRKLGIHNKAELVLWAIQKKILRLPANL